MNMSFWIKISIMQNQQNAANNTMTHHICWLILPLCSFKFCSATWISCSSFSRPARFSRRLASSFNFSLACTSRNADKFFKRIRGNGIRLSVFHRENILNTKMMLQLSYSCAVKCFLCHPVFHQIRINHTPFTNSEKIIQKSTSLFKHSEIEP